MARWREIEVSQRILLCSLTFTAIFCIDLKKKKNLHRGNLSVCQNELTTLQKSGKGFMKMDI